MNKEQGAAYINAQVASALCELASMQAANHLANTQETCAPYTEQDFINIPNRFGIHHNAILTFFQGCD